MPCLRLLLGLCLLTIGITTPCRALAEQPLPMNPASLPRDTALPSLATHASADQQYALYLPPDYSPAEQPERRWPVLIILDPRGRALESLRLAVDGARRHDWVVLSSYQSRSDTQEEITLEAIRALLDEAQNYIAFDPRRLYFAGMSGTAKTLWSVMPSMDGMMAGMIGCGGARPTEYGKFRTTPPAFFGMAGDLDFNHAEMMAQEERLAKVDFPHRLDIFSGSHGWPGDAATFSRAINWLELIAIRENRRPPDAAFVASQVAATRAWLSDAPDELERLRRTEQAIQDFRTLADTTEWQAERAQLRTSPQIKELEKQAKRLESVESRFARDFDQWFTRFTMRYAEGRRLSPPAVDDAIRGLRLQTLEQDAKASDQRVAASATRRLERVYVATSFYLPNAMAASGDTERAIRSLEIAIRVFPDRAGAHWRLATLLARDNAVDKAFRELYRSRELGYLDADDLRTNPDWQSLRSDRRWQSLSQGVQPAIGQ